MDSILEGFDWDEALISSVLEVLGNEEDNQILSPPFTPSSFINEQPLDEQQHHSTNEDVVILDNPMPNPKPYMFNPFEPCYNAGNMDNPFQWCFNVGTSSVPIKQSLDLTGTTSAHPFLHDDKLSGCCPGFAAGPGAFTSEIPDWISNMTSYNAEDLHSIAFPSARRGFNSNEGTSTKVCAVKATEIKDNGPPNKCASTKVCAVKATEIKDNDPPNKGASTKGCAAKAIEIKDNSPPNKGAPTQVCEVKATEVKDNGPPDQNANVGSSTQAMKKRSPNEKIICMSELQPHFTKSIKNAAKSLGVCPTTVKRICRLNGVPKWPSRKLNKVNRCLQKLQVVLSKSEKHVADASLRKFDLTTNLRIATPNPAFYQPFQTARSSLQGNGNGNHKNKDVIVLD